MTRPVAVMGMPRVGVDFPADVEFGKCETKGCIVELGWSRSCPADLPKLCPDCVAKLAVGAPTLLVMLAGGKRTVMTRDVAGTGTVH